MNKKELFGLAKRFTTGILTMGMVMAGIMIMPQQAEATVAADEVVYEGGYDITQYWDAEDAKAPIKEGYVFGGWYSAENEDAYMTKEEAGNSTENTTVYAKFVPAQVLSVKAQNMAGTKEDTESTYVRVITSMDSKNYQKIGFDIWLANKIQLFKDAEQNPLETTRVYDGLLVGTNEVDAEDIFGSAVSDYVGVWQLTNVNKSNYSKIIYVRPYWITMDGTKVEGLAKYVHVEDQYKGLISVPVNLLQKEDVAAGMMDITYSNDALEFVEFEAGRMLSEMKCHHDVTTNTIKMVGNAKSVDQYESGESLYANIRFKKPNATTEFSMNSIEFCDWNEEVVNLAEVWDIKYDVR